MTKDVKTRIDRSMHGEKRINPDEQRKYLNTFKERVILTIDFNDIHRKQIRENFDIILKNIKKDYQVFYVRINGKINDRTSMDYIKTCQDNNIRYTIVSEKKSKSPYGLIVNSDKPVKVKKHDIYYKYGAFLVNDIIKKETPFSKIIQKIKNIFYQ